MDSKIFRSLIYLFAGLVVIFSLLILVNYIGSMTGASSGLPGQAEDAAPKSASAMAQQALAAAKFGGGAVPRASMIPSGRQGPSTAPVTSEGAIQVVKEKEFGGVAEKPKSMMDMLNDMGGGKKGKPSPVRLKDSDLDKQIQSFGETPAEASLKKAAMPELGRGATQEGVTLLTAPADYKLFKSSESWWAFANSHKCRSDRYETGAGLGKQPSPISGPDFTREYVLVLISVSDLPNGIFRITGLDKDPKNIVVSYRVDPLAMAAGEGGGSQHDFYSAAVIPIVSSVKLSQKP